MIIYGVYPEVQIKSTIIGENNFGGGGFIERSLDTNHIIFACKKSKNFHACLADMKIKIKI